MSQLNNQIALVTGAGRGIGQAIALKLAGAGADIVAVDLKAEFCDETVKAVQALGRKVWAFAADVSNAASVDAVVDPGGLGKEPMIRILAPDLRDMLAKVRRILDLL